MKKKQYLVLEEGDLAYRDKCKETEDSTTYKMYMEGDIWAEHVKGSKCFTMKDDGNGIDLDGVYLGYDKIGEMIIMLDILKKATNLMPPYDIINGKILKNLL